MVLADGSVKNLAWRICNAKKVLVSTPSASPKRVVLDGILTYFFKGAIQHVSLERKIEPGGVEVLTLGASGRPQIKATQLADILFVEPTKLTISEYKDIKSN